MYILYKQIFGEQLSEVPTHLSAFPRERHADADPCWIEYKYIYVYIYATTRRQDKVYKDSGLLTLFFTNRFFSFYKKIKY